MKMSGLYVCKKCGVYEYTGFRYLTKKTRSRLEIYFWCNIPKRGLTIKPCPRCKEHNPPYDVVNTHCDRPATSS